MKTRLAFLDWMKAIGMMLIVYGHAPAGGLVMFTMPFNPKQLGVALFVFASGYSLAREQRPTLRVLYNRLFELVLWGGLSAILYSLLSLLLVGDLAESNYLPFLGGINVLWDMFPANPTTWYIGTYLHLLLIWALARRWLVRVSYPMIGAALVLEITARSVLCAYDVNFIAYMAFPNWLALLLVGMRAQQQPSLPPSAGRLAALLGLGVLWGVVQQWLPWQDGFPYARLDLGWAPADVVVTSSIISLLYHGYTHWFFGLTRRLADTATIRFLARNTLLVFIVHMPLVYWLSPIINPQIDSVVLRVLTNLALYYFALSLLSEGLRALVRPGRLREVVWRRLGLEREDRAAVVVRET
jgi:hypothetical protein